MPRLRLRAIFGCLMVLALALLVLGCSGGQLSRDGAAPSAAVCALPFESGPCEAAFPVYASVNGVCVPRIYGGCDGNANRFSTLEECMAVCEGRPLPNGCPTGRIAREICLGCGPAGGCGATATVCALACDAATACPNELRACSDGVCQTGGCI